MFGKKEELNQEANNIVVVTMDNVPNKNIVEVIGLVSYSQNHSDVTKHEQALKREAYKLGANAVVGVKVSFDSFIKDVTGTAVIIE